MSLTGELTPALSIYASALWLDTEQVSGSANIGNDIQNAPDFSGSVYFEYRREFWSGISLSGGVFRVGERAGNAQNTYFVLGYTTIDLGASYYTERFLDKGTTFSLYWEYVTDKRYWAAAGSSLLAPGLPPTIRFSVNMSF